MRKLEFSAIALFVSITLIATLTSLAKAETATIWTDRPDYSPEETVIIYGSGFITNATVSIIVTRPDNSTDTWSVTADVSGAFTTTYQLDGITGTYLVTASDETNTATTTFTDAIGINILDTSGAQHQNYPSRLQFGNIAQGTSLTFTVKIKVTGTYTSVTWQLRYATADPKNNTQLSSQTPSLPATGTNTAPSQENPVSISIATGSLALGTYAGHLEAVRTSGDSPVTSGNFYFDFTVIQATATVTFYQSGVGSDFAGSVLTIDGTTDLGVSDLAGGKTFTWTIGTPHTFAYHSPLVVTANTKQYVWTSTAGLSTAQSDTITVPSGGGTVTGNFRTQYYLTMSTNFGTVSPASGWQEAGTKLDIQAFAPSVIDGEQYVWLGWTGTGLGSYSGIDNPAVQKVTMNGPISETAAWRHEYRLTMATNFGSTSPYVGDHWYEAGATVDIEAFAPSVIPGEQYVWLGWTGIGDINYTGMLNPALGKVTMNSPISETAAWRHEYYLTLTTNPAEVLSLNPAAVSGQGWYQAETTATVDAVQLVDKILDESRFDFRSWTGATPTGVDNKATVYMDGPKTATANYQLQYKLTFSQSGVGSDFSETVLTIDTTNNFDVNQIPTSTTFWWDDLSTHSFEFHSPLTVNSGKRYVWDTTSGLSSVQSDSLFKVTGSGSITGNYKTQYRLTISTSPVNLIPQPTVTLVSGYDAGNGWYEAASVVSIDPDSPAGFTFDHWNGDATGSSVPLSVTIDSAKNIIAVFTFNLDVETGFKSGDSPSFASNPCLDSIMCVLVKVTSGYKLIGTSPGTFDYAIAIKNTGETTFNSITITVTGDLSDFYLQSSNPIRVLNANGNDITPQFTITQNMPTSLTITSTQAFQGLTAGSSLYATIHLDYAKKGIIQNSQVYSAADTLKATVSGTSGPNPGQKDAYGSVAFLSKKSTIIYGFVRTSSGTPIKDTRIELWQGNTLLYTDYTDEDGFFAFINGWEGVTLTDGITYTIKCYIPSNMTDTPDAYQAVTAQKEKAISMLFQIKDQT